MPETAPPQVLDSGTLTSLLAFWRDSGVDACVGEVAIDRLAQAALGSPPVRRAQGPNGETPVSRPGHSASSSAVTAARVAAAAASDLAALESAISSFKGCALRTAGARRSVFARGSPQASVMIIGEAPGAEEDAQGLPFVGRAGKLLDRMLAAAGLTERVFITNTVFWRPPGNRNPTPLEQAVCAPFVDRAIGLVRPRLLMLSGGISTKAMLGREEGILSLRGRWSDWTSQDGELTIPALPTLHPAFLLRQPDAKAKAWLDLQSLMSRLDHTG